MKKQLRKEIMKNRSNLSSKEIADKSKLIMYKVVELVKDYEHIGIYMNYGSEVDTSYLINALANKNLYIPKVISDNEIVFNKLTDVLCLGKYNIRESKESDIVNNLDCIIVPLVGFDSKCNRLGHGKGYYDKYLKNQKILKIGVGYELQCVKIIPTNDKDIPLDCVVSEANIYYNQEYCKKKR